MELQKRIQQAGSISTDGHSCVWRRMNTANKSSLRVMSGPGQSVNVHDLRSLARRRLPRVVFDYLDGGAEDEITLRRNRLVFDELTFRPRHAVAFPTCDLRTRVLGCDLALPAMLAPIGYSSVMRSRGEVAAARAAGEAGTAIHTVNDFRGRPGGCQSCQFRTRFLSTPLIGGRKTAEATIERARNARFAGLFVTIDTAVAGMRERDLRNGMKELIGWRHPGQDPVPSPRSWHDRPG